MGDATYQVKQDEAVIFKGGHLGQATKSKSNCGCPKEAPPPVAKNTSPAPAPQAPSELPASAMLPGTTQPLSPQAQQLGLRTPASGTASAVDAPFIFHDMIPRPICAKTL